MEVDVITGCREAACRIRGSSTARDAGRAGRAGGPARHHRRGRPGGAAGRAARLPPQVQHGAAVQRRRRHRATHPAHADQRVGQLRHGPDRAATRTARPRAGVEEFYRRVRERYPYPAAPRRPDLGRRRARAARSTAAAFAADRFGRRAERASSGSRSRAPSTSIRTAARTGCAASCPGSFCSWPGCGSARSARATTSSSCRRSRRSSTRRPRPRSACAQGQLTLQYHAGGGVLTGEIGALFGRRQAQPQRSCEPRWRCRSRSTTWRPRGRWRSCGSGSRCTSRAAARRSPRDSDEGAAADARQRGGDELRIRVPDRHVRRAAQHRRPTCSAARTDSLVVDSPHNSIYEEEVDGRRAVVHRHNSCRRTPRT